MKKERKPIALLTGGSGYVGTAIAQELIRRNFLPILLSRNPIAFDGAETRSCNISNERALESIIEGIVGTHGHIDACIHAAVAATTRTALLDTPSEAFENEFSVSVRGAFLLAKYAVPHMPKDSTFIGITTVSIEKEKPDSRIGAYLPAKQALRTLLRVLATELVSKRIRVYAVAPPVLPGGLNNSLPEPVRNLLSRQSDGSTASADDVAHIVADLCIDATAFPSGVSITSPSRAIASL